MAETDRQGRGAGARIDIDVEAGQVRDSSTVAGAIVQRVDGNLIIGASTTEPLETRSITGYLVAATRRAPPPANASPELQQLWRRPLRGHVANEPGNDLYAVMQELFRRDRELGSMQRLVLLAGAGIGKSPALEYLRCKAAEVTLRQCMDGFARPPVPAAFVADHPDCVIPLMISLGDLHAGLAFDVLVRDAFNALLSDADVPRIDVDQAVRLLDDFPCLFLFDDLDVLLSANYASGLDHLMHFMETFRDKQYVVACRTSSYRGQLGSVDRLFLEGMLEEDAVAILGNERYASLTRALKDLASNPGMLELILDLDEKARTSQTRGQLLQRWVQMHLGRETSDRFDCDISPAVEETLLERIGFAMQQSHTNSLSEQEIMELSRAHIEEWHERYTWREVLQTRCIGQLLAREDNTRRWQFTSRNVADYFAAAAVLHDPANLQVVLAKVSDYRWRDLLEILVGLVPEPSRLLFELIDRDVLVAAECVAFAGKVDQRTLDALIDGLIERMSQESSMRRKRIVERIGESKHPRAPQALLLALTREWSSTVLLSIAQQLWEWSKHKPDSVLQIEQAELLSPHGVPWQGVSVAGLLCQYTRAAVEGNENDQQSLAALLRSARQPLKVRGMAAFGLGFTGNDFARQTLIELIMNKRADDFVAWCAVDALLQINHPDVRAAAVTLCTDRRYADEKWMRLRARGIYMLGWTACSGESGADAAPAGLLRAALKNLSPIVRGYAVEALVRLDLPDARTRIEKLLQNEQDGWVLQRTAEALGEIGTLDTIALLEMHLRAERVQTRARVRKAIEAIRERHGL